MKTVGTELKSAVTKVETCSSRGEDFLALPKSYQIFLSILNTKKGFLKSVREIATRINEVLAHLRNLPEYANKARKTADDIINFADRAQNYKSEIQKLDIRKQFGIDFDQRVRDVCNEFKTIAADTLNKIGSFDIVQEVDAFFNKEADKLIGKAVSKFRRIKEPIYEIQGELQEIKSIVRESDGSFNRP
ncbi:hypothetical protein OS493_032213 [Desmophyllum pertusum]|uniref:Uncharacterized protein n=1 Tax=Desmophyllum pertusum TaxID=174260 RepID=A0A9W9ZWU8_9CNID|nr:hypothetical protein OS493_032213 [Desmophyllum pertusum]